MYRSTYLSIYLSIKLTLYFINVDSYVNTFLSIYLYLYLFPAPSPFSFSPTPICRYDVTLLLLYSVIQKCKNYQDISFLFRLEISKATTIVLKLRWEKITGSISSISLTIMVNLRFALLLCHCTHLDDGVKTEKLEHHCHRLIRNECISIFFYP